MTAANTTLPFGLELGPRVRIYARFPSHPVPGTVPAQTV